ncbi:MAG: hypothetical protein HKP31_07325 [Nitrosopumilus sp.]|nr:hypothetical protein [Nitrosopumilus sp.]
MKTAAFVPVRLSSTRLPSKALLEIQGKPCIEYLIDRIKQIKELDEIVICTTKNKIDDKIVDLAQKINVSIFRGSETDILDRFKNAAEKFNVQNIVNIDGDDILCEPEFIKETANELKKNIVDYISWKNMPLGTTPIGIKYEAIKTICDRKDIKNTETGWGKFFTETRLFKVKVLTSDDPKLIDHDVRLTLDYKEDFKLFEQILTNLKKPFDLRDVLDFLHSRKDINDLNRNIKDDYWKNFKKKSTKIKMKDES